MNYILHQTNEEKYPCNGPIVLEIPKEQKDALVAASNGTSSEKTVGPGGPGSRVPAYLVSNEGDYLFAIHVSGVDAKPFKADVTVQFEGRVTSFLPTDLLEKTVDPMFGKCIYIPMVNHFSCHWV